MAGSCVVEEDGPLGDELLGDELLAPLLGELGLGELELELELGELELAPPEAEPDFLLSLEADPLMPEDGLDELEDEAPPDGDEGELLGEEEEVELEEPGVDEVLLALSPLLQAATPSASATATAIADSFMCPPGVGCSRHSKLRARPKPLIAMGPSRARRRPCRRNGNSYLLLPVLPELLGLLGLELGLEDFFEALLPVDPVLELPLVPDVLEPLGDDVAPPDADLLASRSHPVTRALPRASASAATNVVNFMLTSVVVCQTERSKEWTGNPSLRRPCSTRITTAVRNSAMNTSS